MAKVTYNQQLTSAFIFTALRELVELFPSSRTTLYPDSYIFLILLTAFRTSLSRSHIVRTMYTARTSVTLTITLLLLHLHPEKLTKLLSEIHATFPDPSEPVTYTKCKDMQYLNAVISETMRFYPIVGPGWMYHAIPCDLRVRDVPTGTEIISFATYGRVLVSLLLQIRERIDGRVRPYKTQGGVNRKENVLYGYY